MAYTVDTITHATTGVKTWTIGYAPNRFKLTAVPAPGATSTIYRCSTGVSDDGSWQNCDSTTIENGRAPFQRRYTDRIISISEWNGSAWAETYKITIDSFTATEVKYNVVTASSAFQLLREAEG